MAFAVPAAGMAAAELAAQLGLGMAASYAIDKGIKKGIPGLLKAGKKITKNSKHKIVRKINRGIGKVEKGYHSKYGKIGQEAASVVGSILAFKGAGKAVGAAKNAYTAANALRAGGTAGAARSAADVLRNVPPAQIEAAKRSIARVERIPAARSAVQRAARNEAQFAQKLFDPKRPPTQEVISKMRPETQAKYHELRRQEVNRLAERGKRIEVPKHMGKMPKAYPKTKAHEVLVNQFNG